MEPLIVKIIFDCTCAVKSVYFYFTSFGVVQEGQFTVESCKSVHNFSSERDFKERINDSKDYAKTRADGEGGDRVNLSTCGACSLEDADHILDQQV